MSSIFRLKRWFYFLLKGVGKKEKEHHLFLLPSPSDAPDIYRKTSDAGYQPNYLGYVYRGQVYQCRRLVNRGKHQYHLRFYDTGEVTGHYELAPEIDVSDHLSGVDLRTMNKAEAEEIRRLLE